MNTDKINVGIVGGTGYTGVELLRILARHPKVNISAITSRSEAGREISDLFPSLRGILPHRFVSPHQAELHKACDIVFFATPNGIAMQQVPELLNHDVRVIDLAADFRLNDSAVWEKWYGQPHACPELLQEAVYGLPEINRRQISTARLVANPGCYPTAVQLGWLPLIEKGCIDVSRLIADVKSGVSGAGRNVREDILYAEVAESFRAYGVKGHRHLPEITQGLSNAGAAPVNLTFVPHLVPMTRGIHATLYATLTCDRDIDLQRLYEDHYNKETFVDILPAGAHPETRSVSGSNHCRIAIHRPQGGDTVVILSVIDNLIKGAAGQAVQNMNIMFGLPESMGLGTVPLCP